ncbi:hypothetical protein MCEMRE182_00513 [Candidatus Nanopelagicaceae bacterium]
MKKLISFAISAFLSIGVLVAAPVFTSAASADAQVNGAFEDLGRCLQSQGKNKVLDVFYLIDESGSLKATDPKGDRADILSSSLQQLASFKNDVTVNYSVGFFAHTYNVWQAWRTVNKGGIVPEAARLNAEVRSRDNGKLTDWLQGINGAIDELNAQHARTNGCSTLIWLTDGGIQLTTPQKTAEAVVNLCDNRFDVLRKNGVTVLGILLKNDDALAQLTKKDQEDQAFLMSLMGPMVTGQGTRADGEKMTCGTYPIPKNYRQGALFVAHDPKDLAYEFLKLPPRIEGCSSVDSFGRGKNDFEIENGVSEFQIVTTARDWSLKDPKGKPVSASSSGIRVFETAGASQIKIGTTHSGVGKWAFSGNGGDSTLFYCSGLDIRIDPGTEFISGKAGILSGKVITQATGLPADLTKYDSDHPITVELITSGKSGSKKQADQKEPASFSLSKFTPGSGSAEAEVRITLYLKTKRGIQLAPVSMSQKIDVRLLSNYPTLKSEPIKLSPLESAKKPATGTVIFQGPKRADGKVCIDPKAKPIVIKDSVSRADSYEITTSGVDASGCLPIRQGEESSIKLSVGNSVTADAHVTVGVPITYYSDAEPGKHFTLAAQVDFDSGVPGNPTPWIILFTILGIVLPLGLIYGLLWWAHRFVYGRQLQRAEYPISITKDGRITGRDGNAIATHGDQYEGRPQKDDVRVLEDRGTILSAKLPGTLLTEPWYEIKPAAGYRVISVGNLPRGITNKHRFAGGKIAPTAGDLGKVWYITIADSALLNVEKNPQMDAKLVIYNRRDNTNLNQHRDSLANVTSKPGLGSDVERLIAAAKAEKIANDGKGGSSGGGGSTGGGNGSGGGSTGGGGGGRPIPTGGPSRPVGAPGAPGSPSRPSMPGAPSRSGAPTISPASTPGGPSRPIPHSSPNPGAPSRPSPPGAPPRRGGPGAPA